MKEIGVFLVGAAGKMGREIVRAIQKRRRYSSARGS